MARALCRGEELHGRIDAAGFVGNLANAQRGFYPGERADYHRLVDMPHMADAERLAHGFAKPGCDRDIETFPAGGPEQVDIVPIGDQHRGYRIRHLAGCGF